AQVAVATTRSSCGPGGAFVGLAGFGPLNQYHYPSYYVDQAGLALDHCNSVEAVHPFCAPPDFGPPEGRPFDAPPDVTTGNFWTEQFYFRGLASTPTPIGEALLVLAVEGVWDNATEAIIDGDQLVFSRIRVRIDIPNLPSNVGLYTV